MDVQRLLKPGAKLVTISSHELLTKSNYQDAGRYIEADLAIPADTEATLPALIEACRRLITPERRRAFDERGKRVAEMTAAQYEQNLAQAASGWDAQAGVYGTTVGGAVESDPPRGLVARLGRELRQQLAAAAVGLHEAPPVHRMVRRLRHRLRRAGRGWRGAGQSRSTDGSASTSNATAICTTRRRCCGRRRITAFRCSR